MLVWNAMPSITPMMSAILREEASMSPIVAMTSDTTLPPRAATLAAQAASSLACRADWAECVTVPESCSIDAAVCCRLLAVCSVRVLRSWLPSAISRLAVRMLKAVPRTCPTSVFRACCMSCSACMSEDASSRPDTTIGWVRSPCVMACATACASSIGRTIERALNQVSGASNAITTPITPR